MNMSSDIPATVDAATGPTWSDTVDVLVIGAGMAGVSAALAAHAGGARVLVVDRGSRLSCTSAMAGGHFYLGGGTPVQTETGWSDSPQAMQSYLEAMSPTCDPEKIRLYAEGSVEHFHWLESLGFSFERSFYPDKAVVQPGTQGLMFSGNEMTWPHRLEQPAPRGHKPPTPGDTGGAALVVGLALDKLDAAGVEVRYETGVTALVTDAGQVMGAAWRSYDSTGHIRARSVIIAAGGFVMNDAMVAEHVPHLEAIQARGMALGNPYDDGLGIRLGQSVGGVADHMDSAFITGPFYPPGETLKGIVVNTQGQRFVNEDAYHARTAAAVFDQPDRVAYLILDSKTMVEPGYGFQPLIDGWESIEEMEAALGMPVGSLEKTMAAYNQHAADGEDPAFHKSPDYLVPLDHGPWGAYDLSPGRCFYSGFTCGGLRVTPDGQLLAASGDAVPGVYAAGACASNIAVDGRGYSSGTQLGEASYFGRRAGEDAASQVRGPEPHASIDSLPVRAPADSLVIGASGFLGSRVTRRLIEQGRSVRVMVRSTSNTSAIDDLPVERYVGDVHDAEVLRSAMDGITDVYYCVVDARPWLRDPAPLQRTNVEALRVVLPIAAEAGLRRFVFTSSIATLTGGPRRSESLSAWRRRVGAYIASRVDAENLVMECSREHGLPAVAMCVANTYGAGDLLPTPHGGAVMMAAFGKLPSYPRASADVVGIDDAADALILAAADGRNGARYAVSESVMSTHDVLAAACDEACAELPGRGIPLVVVRMNGLWQELVSRFTGREALLTRRTARLMSLPTAFDNDKARRELGWQPRPTAESVREATRFFIAERDRRRAARAGGAER